MAELHREVLNWQHELRQYETVGQKISIESDSLQSSRILENIEEAGKRWHSIVNTLTNNMNQNVEPEMDNINSVVQWAEETLSLLTKQVNVSDVSELQLLVGNLEKAQKEAETIGTNFEKFTSNVNEDALKKSKSKVERILQMLPKRCGYLMDRQKKIVSLLNAIASFENVIEAKKTRHRNLDSSEKVSEYRKSLKASEDEMSALMNEFLLIEREVTGSGFNIAADVGTKLQKLKNNWYDLLTAAKDLSNLRPSLKAQADQLSSPVESVYSLGSPSASSTSEDIILSPTSTTMSVSPLSPLTEDVASMAPSTESRKEFILNIKQIIEWLQNLGKHIRISIM